MVSARAPDAGRSACNRDRSQPAPPRLPPQVDRNGELLVLDYSLGLKYRAHAWSPLVREARSATRILTQRFSDTFLSFQPKEVKEVKQFLEFARRKDATAARIKTSVIKRAKAASSTTKATKKAKKGDNKLYKFKLRTSKNLYTLVLKNADTAAKLKQSLPPGLEVSEIGVKN